MDFNNLEIKIENTYNNGNSNNAGKLKIEGNLLARHISHVGQDGFGAHPIFIQRGF
jgi:hypothetical protein